MKKRAALLGVLLLAACSAEAELKLPANAEQIAQRVFDCESAVVLKYTYQADGDGYVVLKKPNQQASLLIVKYDKDDTFVVAYVGKVRFDSIEALYKAYPDACSLLGKPA